MYRMMVTMENPSMVRDISGKVVNMALLTATSAGALILREIDGELKIALAHHQRRVGFSLKAMSNVTNPSNKPLYVKFKRKPA